MKTMKKQTSAGIAELKAKLASYLRRVKSGDEVEILERGIPVAVIHSIRKSSKIEIIPPRKDPGYLANYRFSVHPEKKFDIVALLLEDRQKR